MQLYSLAHFGIQRDIKILLYSRRSLHVARTVLAALSIAITVDESADAEVKPRDVLLLRQIPPRAFPSHFPLLCAAQQQNS